MRVVDQISQALGYVGAVMMFLTGVFLTYLRARRPRAGIRISMSSVTCWKSISMRLGPTTSFPTARPATSRSFAR